MPFQCFDVATRYFEEILLDLIAGISVSACGAAEAHKEQAGK